MNDNPLVAGDEYQLSDFVAPANFDPDKPSGFGEGAGLFGSILNTGIDATRGDWGAFAADTIGVGMDMLGIAMNPFRGFMSAGIGWLIEHVGFLKEPLDLLAGDPEAVTAKAQTWTTIADKLTASVTTYQRSLEDVSTSQGAALVNYRAAVDRYLSAVEAAADHARSATTAINTAGIVVGTTRGLLRDWISEWASDRVIRWIFASSLTPVTFGTSQGIFVTDSIISGTRLATRLSGQLRKVVTKLDDLAGGANDSRDALRRASRVLDDAAGGTKPASRAAAKSPVKDQFDDFDARATRHNDDLVANQAARRQNKHARDSVGDRINNKAKRATERQHLKADSRKLKDRGKELDTAAKDLAGERELLRRQLAGERTEEWNKRIRDQNPELGAFTDNVGVKIAKEGVVQSFADQERREDDFREESGTTSEVWRARGTLHEP